ncbi:MAG: hypothetical protein ACREM6_13845 [Vulcanimicrobiaceae bacterium]
MSEGLRDLFEEDPAAREFLKWASERQNDAARTSIDRLEQKAGVDRRKAIELAKQFDRLGCGRYIIGRRGAPSRIEWEFSLKSIGRAAVGEAGTLETVDPELVTESADLVDLKKEDAVPAGSDGLSIAEAKRRLAITLGVKSEAIEITIRA